MCSRSLGLESFRGKPGEKYSEGQFAFLNCPSVSKTDWHPFTISSAPHDKYLTFHIRIGKNQTSWTRRVRDYLRKMAVHGETFVELNRRNEGGVIVPGKLTAISGLPFFHVYGPCSAPTQHISEYNEVMICASGIGVTPLASCMKEIVFHKWKMFQGHCFPDRAHFFWICSHRDINSFRWFVRTIKEAEDQVMDLRQKNPDSLSQKMFHVHIYVTSFKEQNIDQSKLPSMDDDLAFWGKRRKVEVDQTGAEENLAVCRWAANYTEADLYNAMMRPTEEDQRFGHVWIHNGRAMTKGKGKLTLDDSFKLIADNSSFNDIGVTFCGNPIISHQLAECCQKYTALSEKTFHFHSEVF